MTKLNNFNDNGARGSDVGSFDTGVIQWNNFIVGIFVEISNIFVTQGELFVETAPTTKVENAYRIRKPVSYHECYEIAPSRHLHANPRNTDISLA